MQKEKDMIFGLRPIIEAVESGKEIEKIFIKRELGGELAQQLWNLVHERQIPVVKVPVEKLNRLTRKNHQGAIAYLSPVVYQHIEDIIPVLYEEGKTPFVVVLDGVTDVRNFGAIARTCECAGVDAIVVPMKGGAAANADAVKTSAGALHIIPVCREISVQKAVQFLKDSGLTIVAASEKALHDYSQADYRNPLAIVMGSEDVGISPEVLRLCDQMVSIPVLGKIQSLNVSVAAGVLIYEAVKQRGVRC
ncbi:MAG: 23S rRNA (guanosine(2251)-2'-O)-methyltransferase RlmB [Paludibacteraceae bacterium]|nr:23S rRNA (guanosine(2251)-2'-O)-methyltransferase RlmB [Paludibacteraceae bacterium]